MQDKTSNHAPIPTELNIAPRGKSWLHGQLIDGEQGHPTRQSMESADRAQPIQASRAQAAPTAVALPDGWKLVPTVPTLSMGWAYLDKAREVSPDSEWTFSQPGFEAALSAAPQPPALAATPAAAAKVVFPEPWGYLVEGRIFIGRLLPRHVNSMVGSEGFQPIKLFTEQQLRPLPARVSAPAAQAVEPVEYPYLPAAVGDVVDFHEGRGLDIDWADPAPAGGTSLYSAAQMRAYVDADRAARTEHSAPQAQADARDAEQEKPPTGRYVLAWMEGREIPIRAMWVPKSWLVAGDECPEGWAEYDEEKDEYYCPEGWYEANEHEETHWHVSTPIVAWADLPRRTAIAAQAAQQGGAA